jgi:hypothetical protein
VPTLVAFSYFSKKIEVMSVEMETLVVELITKCYYGRAEMPAMRSHVSTVPAAHAPAPLG